MTAADIARILGGRRCGQWWSCHCPAHDDRAPSLSLRDGESGIIVHCHAGCRPRDVLAALRRHGMLDNRGHDAAPCGSRLPAGTGNDDTERRIALAQRIWYAAQDARGSPVADYLAARDITIAPPASLCWAPSLRRPDGSRAPAMLARIDGPDDKLVGVHRTFLRPDLDGTWHRRDRASLGPIRGSAVRFNPATGRLLVGEGIESVLSAMVLTGWSGWAALSTSGLVGLILPTGVRNVIIVADRDANGAGERAARRVGIRWAAEGRRVRILTPNRVGSDANDLLKGIRHV